ncbi:MAG TPA: hypothetical protein VMM35_10075 [Longimicrobiales bacterium]|nr:hypothetical protein [Longimicrobiales bacterium]
METIETVIGRRTPHFVRIFVSQFGFSEERAEQFVSLAGDDLIESYRWRASDMGHRRLSDPESVRELLGAIRGDHIASSLGLPPSEVWSGLRVFVPRVLQLADGRHALEA